MEELGITHSKINWYGDNQAAIKAIISERNIEKMCHILSKVHFLQEIMEKYSTTPIYLQTEKMTADIFTKALPRPAYEKHRANLDLEHVTEFSARGSVGI
jgi:hypothetical protein